MSTIRRICVLCLICSQGLLLAVGATVHSPVMDELAHLSTGISNWELGRFDLYKVNPPLIRMISALPALWIGVHTDYRNYVLGNEVRAEGTVMEDFVVANGNGVISLIVLSRCSLIPIVLLGAWACYRWARDLYGDLAGVVALILWCFCPNILAYGQHITADAGATALGTVAGYSFWKWLKNPIWERALIAGIALGVAALAKTIWMILFILWPMLWMLWHWSHVIQWISLRDYIRVKKPHRCVSDKATACQNRAAPKSEAGVVKNGNVPTARSHKPKATYAETDATCHGAASTPLRESTDGNGGAGLMGIVLLGLLCINVGYNFEESCKPLRDYSFVSRPLTGKKNYSMSFGNRFARSLIGWAPVPLPKSYLEGIDLQWHDIEQGKPSYLRGRWQERGWWYWYIYALVVKVPLGTVGLLVFAIGMRFTRWRQMTAGCPVNYFEKHALFSCSLTSRKYEFTSRDEVVLLSPAIVLLVIVSSQTGFTRYIRYVLPILPFVFIWTSSLARSLQWSPLKYSVPAVLLLVWTIGSSLYQTPHWMAYFNELTGGPMGGPKHLIDAQIDWGQDLLNLKKWLDARRDERSLQFVYFGPIDPTLAGIEYSLPLRGALNTDDRAEVAKVPEDLAAGLYAVSVNHLYGYPHYVYDGKGHREWINRPYFSYFRRFRPTAYAGYSIYIYRITANELARIRHVEASDVQNDDSS